MYFFCKVGGGWVKGSFSLTERDGKEETFSWKLRIVCLWIQCPTSRKKLTNHVTCVFLFSFWIKELFHFSFPSPFCLSFYL